jgi:hypothetical protein
MKTFKRLLAVALFVAILCTPLFIVHGAGGTITGKITDPKDAAIVGATVTAINTATRKEFNGVTDRQGKYKIEGLPAGEYEIKTSAKGFAESSRSIKVGDAEVSVDIKLEIGAVEAQVRVTSEKGNTDPIYQQLRLAAKTDQDFAGSYATVNNLKLQRDLATFLLRSGEIYFLTPVEGRVTTAVFIGDGEFSLTPPLEVEQHNLSYLTGENKIVEQFDQLVLRFTDKTFQEINSSPAVAMKTGGPAAGKARDIFRDNQQLTRKRLRDNQELRTLFDLLNPSHEGFFNAYIDGKRFNKLIFTLDPLGIPGAFPEEVALISYGETDGGIWTAFHRKEEYAKRTASSSEDRRIIDITHHEIDGAIKGTHIAVTDKITFRSLLPGTRVLPFALFGALRVTRVQDGEGQDLAFVQESKDDDPDFGIILPKALEVGQTYQISVQYDGDEALRDSGGGNFILVPRSTWYPGNANSLFAEDRAIFDMTFRYPKSNLFVGTGSPSAPDSREGDTVVAKWSSGKTELAVAGFNYGRFKKKEIADQVSGYNVEFYANLEVPDQLKQIQSQIDQMDRQGNRSMTTLGSISTSSMADSALADAQNSVRIYNLWFGKLPYTRIAMTQQPAPNFGQAWPTLVYMPYLAFIDATQRTQLLGIGGGTDNFWRYVAPHEIAHQWWGHIIGWDSYHDQWMSEGFAEFSASLYVQLLRGNDKFVDFWEDQRKRIVESSPATRDRKPYTIGPVTQGYRLNNAKTGAIAQRLIYPKGAYILHMIRMMMQDQGGDARFQAMMKDFVHTHYNQDVSTEDFKRSVEKYMTAEMNVDGSGKMDWFFNQWVYGTMVPSYKFESSVSADGTLNGKVTQSGVPDNFIMLVPIYLDFGKGWVKLGSARIAGNNTLNINGLKLPSVPKRVAICALNDVLAVNIDNGK